MQLAMCLFCAIANYIWIKVGQGRRRAGVGVGRPLGWPARACALQSRRGRCVWPTTLVLCLQDEGRKHYYLALDTYVEGNWSSPAAQVRRQGAVAGCRQPAAVAAFAARWLRGCPSLLRSCITTHGGLLCAPSLPLRNPPRHPAPADPARTDLPDLPDRLDPAVLPGAHLAVWDTRDRKVLAGGSSGEAWCCGGSERGWFA